MILRARALLLLLLLIAVPLPLSSQDGSGCSTGEEVAAYWPYWFEFNKEWILAEKLRERGSRGPLSENSSVWWFRWASGQKSSSPVTKDQRQKIVLPLLLESLQSRSVWVRDAAVIALGKLGGPGTVPAISGRLKDKERDIREHALLALGLSGQKIAADPLRRTLARSDPDLKAYAALGLALLGRKDAKTIALLRKEYRRLCRGQPWEGETAGCVAIALGALCDGDDEDLVDDLAKPLRPVKGRETLKIHVCQALGRIGGDVSRDWLNRAMLDKSKEVRAAATLALSDFPSRRVVRDLRKVKSGHRMSKLYSLLALGSIGSKLPVGDRMREQISADLVKYATSPPKDKYATMYGAMGLALMGDDSANEYFAEQLTVKNRAKFVHEVHSGMAMALGLLGDRRAVRDLERIAFSSRLEPELRGYAAFALGLLGDTASKEEIKERFAREERPEMLRSGCWAVGLMGDGSDVPWLIERLKKGGKGHAPVRGAAVIAIGMIGDGAAVDPLVAIIREGDDDESRAFAIAALGCLVDPEPLPRIPRLFRNFHYRMATEVLKDVMSVL